MANAKAETIPERTAPAATDVAAAPAKKNKSRPYVILGAVVAVAVLGYAGFTALTRGRENTDDAQVDADVVTVSARVGGVALHVYVSDNQPVKKGDPLVDIDPADLDAKAKQLDAEVAAAKAQSAAADAQVQIVAATSKGGLYAARAALSGSTTSVASADASVQSAKAALTRAQSDAQKADMDLARANSLKKDEAIPQAQVDTAQANADSAHAAVAQAQAQLAMAQDMRSTAQSRIAEAQGHVDESAPVDARLAAARANADLAHARVASGEAELVEAKLQLSYTHIVAPADGVMSKLVVREGQLVQAGQQIVAIVPETTYIIANYKETQVGTMHTGQRVEIEIDGYPGRSFEGVVQSRSPGTGGRFSLLPPDNASGNFVKVVQRVPVKIAWSNLPTDVKPSAGMSADVTVITR
jgi:membrane fusion protein (multidrug efflux system)